MEDFVARRTKMAEAKITQAEAHALSDVRSVAAEVATSAAEKVLRRVLKELDPTKAFTAQSVERLNQQLEFGTAEKMSNSYF